MKKLILILIALAVTGGMAWGQTVPDNWTDDSGIDTYQESTVVHGGSYSCKINVNTGSQSSCDFDNQTSISVTAGNTYTVKFWYQTSAHVKARIILKWTGASTTYGNYTNAGETSWTEFSQSGTVPSGATSLTLDIRFYDQSGFSAPETQYIDDLTFESPTGTSLTVTNGDLESWPSSGNDETTEVYDTGSQPAAGTISSLDDTQGEAVDVFQMTIEDQGSGDGLATHVTNIRIQPNSTNTADWTNTIQGVTLTNNTTSSAVTIGTPTITDTYIDIPITSGNLDVADGAAVDVTVGVYLNTNGITDGDVLSFKVTAASHGFTADASGSDFISTFSLGDFNSNDFTIQVTATELQFSGVPSTVTTGTDFSATVSATDANGNVDTDDATSVTLSLKTGTGTLSSATGLTQSLSSGTYTWNDLQYNTAESFTMAANGGSFAEVVTGSITASDPEYLILSLLCDPQDNYSTDRYIQIYNAGTSSVDLTDYSVVAVGNGSDIYTWTLSGNIKPGEVKTCGDDGNTRFTPDFAPTDWDSNDVTWNGGTDDGAKLLKNSTIVDDASAFSLGFANKVAVRKASVTSPTTLYSSSEWTTSSVTNADDSPSTPTYHECNNPVISLSTGNWSTLTSSYGNGVSYTVDGTVTVDNSVSNPAECNDLTVNAGYSLTISTGKALTVHGDLTNNNYITINSASGATDGSLIVNGSVSGSGDFNVQRYMGYTSWDDTHGWHFLSSPVASQAISAFHTAGSGDDFYKWDEANDIWVNRTASGGGLNGSFETDFEVGTGYLVAYGSATTKTFIGTINTSDVSKSSLSKTVDGYHLLGNPFPSALKWNQTAWGLSNIDATAQIWNEATASYEVLSAGDTIPPMQGFMVHVNDAAGGSLTIDASDRIHGTTNWYKSAAKGQENKLLLTAVDPVGKTAQKSIIVVKEDATDTGFDTQYDSHFLAGFAPQFYSVTDGIAFSLNALPSLSDETEIPFTFIKNNSTDFYITIEGIETLNPAEKVYLKDLKTGYTQLMNDNPRYEFSSQDGDDPNRFVLLFAPVGIEENIAVKPFNIYNSGSRINIVSNDKNNDGAVARIYNVAGQQVKTVTLSGTKTTVDMGNAKGIYVVSVISGSKSQNQKVVLN